MSKSKHKKLKIRVKTRSGPITSVVMPMFVVEELMYEWVIGTYGFEGYKSYQKVYAP